MLHPVSFSSMLQFLLALGYIILGVIILIMLIRLLGFFHRRFVVCLGTPIPWVGHRAYFYRYLGGVFYSESFLKVLFIRLMRNKKWAIHSTEVGYVKRPYWHTDDKDITAKIFSRSFGQKENVAVAKFVHDPVHNIKKADIIMAHYSPDGKCELDEEHPVGYVDEDGDIFKYYENYITYKKHSKLPEAYKIGTCCNINRKTDKEFDTNGEDTDIKALPYIKDDESAVAEGADQGSAVSPLDEDKLSNSLPDSWFSFRINWPESRKVKASKFDSTSRRPIAVFFQGLIWRFINVVPVSWDLKAKAFGYGYSVKNKNWFKPDNLNEIPLIYIGCAALLLLEEQGFLRYEDEAIKEPRVGWAETVLISLLSYLLIYKWLFSWDFLTQAFPFIGPDLSQVVMVTMIFYAIWSIFHFSYFYFLNRPYVISRFLNMMNTNVGTLRYTRATTGLLVIGLIINLFYFPYILLPFFITTLTAILINRQAFPQRRWSILDPFEGEDERWEDGDTSELEKRNYKWHLQSAFRKADFSMDLFFHPEAIDRMRELNPFKSKTGGEYSDIVKGMLNNELSGNIDSQIQLKLPKLPEIINHLNFLLSRNRFSRVEKLNMILAFVQQSIAYKTDPESQSLIEVGISNEYCRFSRETLFDQEGDCDCKSELAAALFASAGYKVAYFTTKDHAFVGISGNDMIDLSTFIPGSGIKIGNEEFLYCETTGDGWTIGKVPEGFNSSQVEGYAIIETNVYAD